MNLYPVIFISLKDVSCSSYSKSIYTISSIIQQLSFQHQYLMESARVHPYDRELICKFDKCMANEDDLSKALFFFLTPYLNIIQKRLFFLLMNMMSQRIMHGRIIFISK